MAGYDKNFYDANQNSSLQSAREVVPHLLNEIHPRSVIDVGCGHGAWLKAFHEAGVQDYLGMDGDWVKPDMLLVSREKFVQAQLITPPKLERTFDLALSLEVAEHLPQPAAASFVNFLTEVAPVIAFSAAIPGQGGTMHLNERWQSYWCELFLKQGYKPWDFVRKKVWTNPRVCYWYAQNLIVYVRDSEITKFSLPLEQLADCESLNIVHPRLFEEALRPNNIALSKWFRAIPHVLKTSAKTTAKRLLRS